MKPNFFPLILAAVLALPSILLAQSSLEERFQHVLPRESEETWRAVGWRANLMEAREAAQEQNRPIFLWIMVGNPQGCT